MDSLVQDFVKANELWRDFERELLYQNRFFPNTSEMLERIKKLFPVLTDTIDVEGNGWYRAREYEKRNLIALYPDDYDSLPDDKKEAIHRDVVYSLLIESTKNGDWVTKKSPIPKFFSEMYTEKEKSYEWGYSREDSGRPPRDKAGLNRASPRYIAYLYLSHDVNTALAEARALQSQYFSVAKYKIIKPLKIVNLCQLSRVSDSHDITPDDISLRINISRVFSSPSRSDEKDYLVSQYIAEYIKTLGYEGLAFDSSRNKGGINLTLFDDSSCEFLGSSIHEVTDIKVKSRQLLPLIYE